MILVCAELSVLREDLLKHGRQLLPGMIILGRQRRLLILVLRGGGMWLPLGGGMTDLLQE